MEVKKKIRVLRIINRFNIGGPTYNATFLTRFLSDEFETLLIGGLPEEGEADSLHVLEKYDVHPVLLEELQREPSLKADWKAYKRIRQIIQEFKPDIVHTHAAKAGALGRLAARKEGVPIIVHTFHGHVFHSYFGRIKTFVFKQIERWLANRTSGIIVLSENQRKELVETHNIVSPQKVKIVSLGFDLKEFYEKRKSHRLDQRKVLGLDDDTIAIAIVGRLVPVKDHDFFLDALKVASPKLNRKVHVFIVGDGSEKERLEERVKKMMEEGEMQVSLTSWIKDVGSFNAAMDIICLTSKNEGTPVSLIEAQAANIPVLTLDVGGIKDIVVDGITGIIIPKRDASLFAEKLVDLVNDDVLRNELSMRGWDFVGEKYNYSTLVANMSAYYKELLA